MNSVNNRISQILKEKGLNQYELAPVLGITAAGVSKMMKQNKLKVAQLKKIAIFLQIDPNYLIGYEDDVTNQNIHKMQESVFAYKNQTNTSHYASNSKAIIKDINDCNREVEFLRDKLKSQEELINSLRSDINTKQTLIDLLASPRK